MPQIASYDDVKVGRKERETPTGTAWRTNFIMPDENNPTAPMAFLVEGVPGREIRSHFHDHDQYQVIVSGDGVLGKHQLQVNAVHFSRRHTPYGPIVFGQQMGFLTLRAEKDAGAQYLDDPATLAKLKSLENRKPWQATELPKFEPATADATLHTFTDLQDEEGLASFSLSVAANSKALAPDPVHSNGQYLIIVRGSLHYEGKEYKALSVAFVKPQEGAFELVAGAEGLDVLVLHFPKGIAQSVQSAPHLATDVPGTRVWQCMLCAFVYDEAKGMPHDGVAPGTPWEDVPETWFCPDCSASKSDFQMAVMA